jgi:5-formaminoimidazole-4-carboxamide-1-beta-D-ribofuranosyl 5'-monophosphate synthetase
MVGNLIFTSPGRSVFESQMVIAVGAVILSLSHIYFSITTSIGFEISARQDGGTNTLMDGSPYSYLRYGQGMSMGRRYCVEIKEAIKQDRLIDILT